MKRIIDGKRYNTETATKVAENWNGLSTSDFQFEREELYITSKGNWFLYGRGGAMSSYAKVIGNEHRSSSEITPFTEDEAYKWCECHNKTNAIDEYFRDKVVDA